jgi:hypothetical protein
MKMIDRKETLELILSNFGDLKISPEYYYKDYPRTISTTWETDRHIQCGHFSDMTKSKDKFISSNILFFEIRLYILIRNIGINISCLFS